MRTVDPTIVASATDQYQHELTGLNLSEWLANPLNVALANENGDVALFERQYYQQSAVYGHYFFKARGVAACKAAKAFLEEIFTGPYNVELIVGLTPADHKGALRMNTYLGFTSYGQIEVQSKPYEFVMLTKHDWETK